MQQAERASPLTEPSSRVYPWYLVAVLTIAYAFSFLDRYVLNLLVEPIKRDFRLSDLGVSLLQGFAFSIFLAVSGLPIGRLVDRSRRMTIIACGIGLWSLMTAGCGLAGGFLGLLLCRIGVAVGEATLLPAGFSAIRDAVPRHRFGLASGLFSMGAYVGGGLAFLAGGALIARFSAHGGLVLPSIGLLKPWEAVFVCVGAPGLLLAFLAATLREPRRRDTSPLVEAGLSDVARFFRSNRRTLVCLVLCGAFATLSMQAMTAWVPSLMIRAYGFTIVKAGSAFGSLVILCGIFGVLAGGLVGDALTNRGRPDGRLMVMIGGGLCAFPFAVLAPIAGSATLTLALMVPALFFGTMSISNAPPALQEIVPGRLQGIAVAAAVLVVNLIGLGLGPTSVAFISDVVLRDESKLQYSIAIVSFVALCLSLAFGLATRRPYVVSRTAFDGVVADA